MRSEILPAASISTGVSWDVMPCSLILVLLFQRILLLASSLYFSSLKMDVAGFSNLPYKATSYFEKI